MISVVVGASAPIATSPGPWRWRCVEYTPRPAPFSSSQMGGIRNRRVASTYEERNAAAGRDHGAGLHASSGRTRRSRSPASRPAGDPRVLSGRLEPRLRRPDGALQELLPVFQSSTPSSSASRSTASGATWPSPRPQAAFPAAGRLRAQGRGRRAYGVYRAAGRHQRAGAVRDRRATASCAGATSRRSTSTPAPTGSCERSRAWRRRTL